MVRDLSDPYEARRRQAQDVRRLQASTAIQNTAVDRGALRVKSAEGLEVGTAEDPTGSEVVYGILRIIGQLLLEGDMEVTGGGSITVGGVVITPLGGGRIQIGPNIRLDSQTQRLTIGTGASQIVLDLTQFKVGPAFKMDPAHSSTGAQIEFGLTGESTVYGDDAGVQIVNTGGDTPRNFSVDNLGFRLMGAPPRPSGMGGWYAFIGTDERLYRATGGTGGGPGDGIFAWPFPLDQVTSEFRSAERPNHDGIDFGIGESNTEGTPIPAGGAGVVTRVLSANDGTHGWGNGVVIDHGTDPLYGDGTHNIKTLYAHMSTAPVVGLGDPVALGATLGPIGNTGNSFGNHLHYEIWVDDVPVNPRTFMAAHGG